LSSLCIKAKDVVHIQAAASAAIWRKTDTILHGSSSHAKKHQQSGPEMQISTLSYSPERLTVIACPTSALTELNSVAI